MKLICAGQVVRRAVNGALVLMLGAALSGCESLLEVQAPSRVLADSLVKASNAKLLVDGARAAFGCAFQAYVTGFGLMTDELDDTQLAAAAWNYDRRAWTGVVGEAYAESDCTALQIFGIYTPVQTARWQADFALEKLKGFSDADVPGRTSLIATAALYAGYGYTLLGEGFCSAAIDGGPEITPAQVFAAAEGKFTEAINGATAPADVAILNAAQVGRARVRLNLGKKAEAKTDAQAVPTAFVYNMPYNSAAPYSENRLARRNRLSLLYSVGSAFRNLTFGGVADPRVKVTNSGIRGADAVSFVWYADKYTTVASPIALARWQEAQLIIAEVDGGQPAVDIINNLHQRVGLPLWTPANVNDPQEILTQIIDERRRELFLESQRGYDFTRYNLPLVPAPGATFPIKGGTYGDNRCLPLPDVERLNNPTLKG